MPSETDAFSERAQLTEWMDEPCGYADFRDCLRDLAAVNWMVLAYRPTLNWLEQFADSAVHTLHAARPLHIVDVGCGGGDMLRRIELWARDRKVQVQLVGIDRNPFAAQAAREFSGEGSNIDWISCDAFAYLPQIPVDLVISSLFTHHLLDGEIVQFVQWMERTAVRGWFINDLYRARAPYYLFKLLAEVMRWHRFVRHDGPVSILRSFTARDWSGLLREAGLPLHTARVFNAWPARLCVGRAK